MAKIAFILLAHKDQLEQIALSRVQLVKLARKVYRDLLVHKATLV